MLMVKDKYRTLEVITDWSSSRMHGFGFFFFFTGSSEPAEVFNLLNEALHKQYCFLQSRLRYWIFFVADSHIELTSLHNN